MRRKEEGAEALRRLLQTRCQRMLNASSSFNPLPFLLRPGLRSVCPLEMGHIIFIMRWARSLTIAAMVVAACIGSRVQPGALQRSDTLAPSTVASSNRADATPELLLSRQLLEQAGLRVGDTVTLATTPSGTRTAQFKIVAAYEPTPDPTHFTAKRLEARLHLLDLMALTSNASDPQASESVSQLNVALASPADANAVKSAVAARAPGLSVRPTSRPSAGTDLFG